MINIQKDSLLKRKTDRLTEADGDVPINNHLIQLEKVTKTYHTDAGDFTALNRVDLTAEAGEFVAILGKSGSGKSTLINGLIKKWRQRNKTVGVLAIDPSSHKTGGALLGDRTRMLTDPDDQGVFVRSLAARGQLGGLSQLTFPSLVLMRALYDVSIIETVGVGQSERDITMHADSIVLCVQPGSGDSLQFMKSGIMEIPDIASARNAKRWPHGSVTSSQPRYPAFTISSNPWGTSPLSAL